jgi:hypothetical protein
MLRRPPTFEKIVLDRGDEAVGHAGGGSGLAVNLAVVPTGGADISDDQRSFLTDHGIDWGTDSGDL